ncbi:response regulator [Corynebacterium sp. ZY180755]
MSENIRILIADDQPMIASALKTILSSSEDLEVVATAGDGLRAVELAREWDIDVAVLDIQMPRMDGIEAARLLLKEHEDLKVLMLTTFNSEDLVGEALETGVHGFLLKDADPEVLADAIRRIHQGASVLSPDVTQYVIDGFRLGHMKRTRSEEETNLVSSLTAREKQVLSRVARAETNAEIAEALFIGVATVKTYVSRLITKLGVRDRVGLAVWAHKFNVVEN